MPEPRCPGTLSATPQNTLASAGPRDRLRGSRAGRRPPSVNEGQGLQPVGPGGRSAVAWGLQTGCPPRRGPRRFSSSNETQRTGRHAGAQARRTGAD